MENNENLVTEQVAENVEVTTEETPKMYTQDEVNAIVGKSKARATAKVRKEYEKKYGDIEEILKAGMEVGSIAEAREGLRSFYANKGKPVPSRPSEFSAGDIEVLANADASEIIRAGYEDVVEEVDRLAALGADNMTAREKAYFKVLAEHRQKTERQSELAKIGVTEEVYNSEEFQNFAKQFNSTTPIADIFNIYNKTQPKKEIKTMGSMKSTPTGDAGVKDYYSFEEAKKFTKADFDKNPALYKAVTNSMTKW